MADRRRLIKWTIAGLGVVYLLLCLGFSRTPQWLIVGGGAVQTLLLPVLGAGVLAIRKQRAEIHPPGRGFNAALYLSMAIITVAAVYSVWRLLRG